MPAIKLSNFVFQVKRCKCAKLVGMGPEDGWVGGEELGQGMEKIANAREEI